MIVSSVKENKSALGRSDRVMVAHFPRQEGISPLCHGIDEPGVISAAGQGKHGYLGIKLSIAAQPHTDEITYLFTKLARCQRLLEFTESQNRIIPDADILQPQALGYDRAAAQPA